MKIRGVITIFSIVMILAASAWGAQTVKSLKDLNCSADQIAKFDGVDWVCSSSVDSGLTILDLSAGTISITSPGYYVLDRNWNIPAIALMILANDVTVDLRGYTIGGGGTTITIAASSLNVTLRNGRIIGNGSLTMRSGLVEGLQTRLDVSLGAPCSELCSAGRAPRDAFRHSSANLVQVFDDWIIESSTFSRLIVSPNSDVQSGEKAFVKIFDNEINCFDVADCIVLDGYGSRFERNQIYARPNEVGSPVVLVSGIGNSIVGNMFRYTSAFFGHWTCGDVPPGCSGSLIDVSGNGNIINGTMSFGLTGQRLAYGLRFIGGDGNAYGMNYFQADVPYDLGATTQIDLGGNR